MKKRIFIVWIASIFFGCGTGILLQNPNTGTAGGPGGEVPTSSFSSLATMVPAGAVVLSSANFTVVVSSPFLPVGSIAGSSFSSSDPLLELGDAVIEAFGE